MTVPTADAPTPGLSRDRDVIARRLRAVTASVLGDDRAQTLDWDCAWAVDLGLDSLDQLALVVAIENEFRCALPSDASTLPTLGDVLDFLVRNAEPTP